MFTYSNDFRVKKTIGSSWNVDEDDVVKTKTALKKTGDYKQLEWGVTGYPDQDMFDGLKSFQKREGLQVDGVMKPGGPTETRLREKSQPAKTAATGTASTMVRKSDPANAGATSPQPKNRETGYGGLPDWSGIKLSPGPSLPPEDISEIAQELPGGRKRGPARKQKRPGDQEVAFAPLIPVIAAGGAALVRNGPQILRGLQGILRAAPLVGAAEEARKKMERSGDMNRQYPSPIPQVPEDKDLKSNRANMDRADPPPPTPGFEPPDEKLPDRTESSAEPVELPDLSGSIPETTEPTVFVFPVPDDDLKQAGMVLENRRGNPVTQAEINEIQKGVEAANPGWTHVGGGINRDKHGLKKEFWIPSVAKTFGGDGRKGGSFADLTFKTPSGKRVHIQTVDIVPKTGKVTQAELDAADRIRRSGRNVDVILIPKGVQIDKYFNRSNRN